MPTPEHNDVVAALAGVLTDAFGAGTALYRAAAEAGGDSDDANEPAGFEIAFGAEGTQLAGLLAVLDGVVVAYEAATAAVVYDLARPDHLEEGLDAGQLRSIVNDVNFTFEIVELFTGSFGGTLRALPKPSLAQSRDRSCHRRHGSAQHRLSPTRHPDAPRRCGSNCR